VLQIIFSNRVTKRDAMKNVLVVLKVAVPGFLYGSRRIGVPVSVTCDLVTLCDWFWE